jgi:hypothetical protein
MARNPASTERHTKVLYPKSRGKILGVKLMPEGERFEWDAEGGLAGTGSSIKWYGLAPVLRVNFIVPKVQTTLIYGHSLYMLHNDVSIFDNVTGWEKFMDQFVNKQKTWSELVDIPIWPHLVTMAMQPTSTPNIERPVAEAKLTLIGAGYHPLHQFWLEFQGNFFLGFPLFQPEGGGNYQIAYGGGPAKQGAAALTANGFDVPPGDGEKKC